MSIVRGAALAALMVGVGGCNDEGDDDGPIATIDGGLDGGLDAGPGADACVPPTNTVDGGTELAAALDRNGTRVDQRRAELVIPPFCAVYTACGVDAGSAASCVQTSLAEYAGAVAGGETSACLDATLDFSACLAVHDSCASNQCTAAQARCGALLTARDAICRAGKDGGS